MDKAQSLFLRFSGEKVLEKTQFGEVLSKNSQSSRIYINGVRIAEEENFLFSYNITSLTAAVKKALNRERTNVGRVAYAERVKSIRTAPNSVDTQLSEFSQLLLVLGRAQVAQS